MRVLADRRIVGVAKADYIREGVNRLLLARQEVPVIRRFGAPVLPGIDVTLGLGERRSIFRLEADRHRVEVFSEIERDRFHRAQFPVQNFRAERGAIEVDEGKHDRLFSKKIADAHGLSRFVSKHEVRRNLRVQILRDAHFAQDGGRG